MKRDQRVNVGEAEKIEQHKEIRAKMYVGEAGEIEAVMRVQRIEERSCVEETQTKILCLRTGEKIS